MRRIKGGPTTHNLRHGYGFIFASTYFLSPTLGGAVRWLRVRFPTTTLLEILIERVKWTCRRVDEETQKPRCNLKPVYINTSSSIQALMFLKFPSNRKSRISARYQKNVRETLV